MLFACGAGSKDTKTERQTPIFSCLPLIQEVRGPSVGT